jgi:hypothetical protein
LSTAIFIWFALKTFAEAAHHRRQNGLGKRTTAFAGRRRREMIRNVVASSSAKIGAEMEAMMSSKEFAT